MARWHPVATNFGWSPNAPTPRASVGREQTDPGFVSTTDVLLRRYPGHEALVEDALDLSVADIAVMKSKTGRGPSSAQTILFQRADSKVRKQIVDITADIEIGKAKAQQSGNGSNSGAGRHRSTGKKSIAEIMQEMKAKQENDRA